MCRILSHGLGAATATIVNTPNTPARLHNTCCFVKFVSYSCYSHRTTKTREEKRHGHPEEGTRRVQQREKSQEGQDRPPNSRRNPGIQGEGATNKAADRAERRDRAFGGNCKGSMFACLISYCTLRSVSQSSTFLQVSSGSALRNLVGQEKEKPEPIPT